MREARPIRLGSVRLLAPNNPELDDGFVYWYNNSRIATLDLVGNGEEGTGCEQAASLECARRR